METLKELIHKLNREKELYRYYQIRIENLKYDVQCGYDPYDYPNVSEWDYQMAVQRVISDCSFVLKTIQESIKELRKKIKTLQRENNEKRI